MPTTTSQHQRTAAITDAGSGLGRDIALGLAAKNHRVYGTAISAEEIADLEQALGASLQEYMLSGSGVPLPGTCDSC